MRSWEVRKIRKSGVFNFKTSHFPNFLNDKLEAAIGFEPMNEGFADLCLSHLATPPFIIINEL